MHILQNSKLKISIKQKGAELCGIQSIKKNTQFMWDANPNVWSSFAPNLFPIIGMLKDDTYIFNNETYKLPKHGFIRHNKDIIVDRKTKNSITFKLTSSSETLKMFPFHFEFYISYVLQDNSLKIEHTIINTGNQPMYFSLGGHPAFKCPVFENEKYDDYFLEFEHKENSSTHLINTDNGLISSKTKSIFNNTNKLPLNHELFNDDALIFKDLKSKKVHLKSKNHGEILSFKYNDFTYLGVWAKPEGDYVCIEPWLGIADSENTNQEFTTKEGNTKLDANKTFKASYTIEIHNQHLE